MEETIQGWGYAVFGEVVDGFETVEAIAVLQLEILVSSRCTYRRDFNSRYKVNDVVRMAYCFISDLHLHEDRPDITQAF